MNLDETLNWIVDKCHNLIGDPVSELKNSTSNKSDMSSIPRKIIYSLSAHLGCHLPNA